MQKRWYFGFEDQVACVLLCRDTYPNQHVEISVRIYIYRWITTDVSGIPQVRLKAKNTFA